MRRSTPRVQLEKLRSIPLFSTCSDRELAKIDARVDEFVATKGTHLIRQGVPGREAFIVVSGQASVTIDGKRIATRYAGDVIGEMALLSRPGEFRAATVTADTPMELLGIEPRSFQSVVGIPSVARKLLGAMANKVRETNEAAVN